jgi:hypothetical protein
MGAETFGHSNSSNSVGDLRTMVSGGQKLVEWDPLTVYM